MTASTDSVKRDLLIKINVLTTKGSDDLSKTLNSFSTKQLEDLKGNVDLLARDLEKPSEVLLTTLNSVLAREPLETLHNQDMEELFKKYLPEEYLPTNSSDPSA